VYGVGYTKWILGVKYFNAEFLCLKCHVQGERVQRTGKANTEKQQKEQKRCALAYLNMNAPKRTMEEMTATNRIISECNDKYCSGTCWNDEDCPDLDYFELYSDDDKGDYSSEEEEEQIENDQKGKRMKRKKKKLQHPFIRHRTLLSKIHGFDLIRDIPLDYLHLLCLGEMKMLLTIWIRELFNENQVKEIGDLLTLIRDYCPVEFQRRC